MVFSNRYFIIGLDFKKNDSFKRVSLFVKTVDFVLVILIILTVLGNYYILTKEEKKCVVYNNDSRFKR